MKLTNKRKLILFFLILGLTMMSCSEVLVKNTTQAPVQVQMYMPGWTTFEVRSLDANDSYMFQAEESGQYIVTAIAEESYINEIKRRSADLTYLLTTSEHITDKDLQILLEDLTNLNDMIRKMNGVGCNGEVSDENTPVVTISFDPKTNYWTIECDDNKQK